MSTHRPIFASGLSFQEGDANEDELHAKLDTLFDEQSTCRDTTTYLKVTVPA